MAEAENASRSVGVASTRAVFSNYSVIRNGGISTLDRERKNLVSLMDSIEQDQKSGIISIQHAIQVQARSFTEQVEAGQRNPRNFTAWGQPTKAWMNNQNTQITGECE